MITLVVRRSSYAGGKGRSDVSSYSYSATRRAADGLRSGRGAGVAGRPTDGGGRFGRRGDATVRLLRGGRRAQPHGDRPAAQPGPGERPRREGSPPLLRPRPAELAGEVRGRRDLLRPGAAGRLLR